MGISYSHQRARGMLNSTQSVDSSTKSATLFRQMSGGCTPPRKTAILVSMLLICSMTLSMRWDQNMSYIRRLSFPRAAPGIFRVMTCEIHCWMPHSFIYPSGWTVMIPDRNLSLNIVFLLKISVGFSFVQSAIQPKTTEKFVCSLPVVFMQTGSSVKLTVRVSCQRID